MADTSHSQSQSQFQSQDDHDYEDGHLPIEEIHARRIEELEALHAYYGNDVTSSLRSSDTAPHRNARRRPSADEDDAPAVEGIPIAGPWFLRIRHPSNDFATDAIPGHQSDNAHGNSHREDGRGLGIPTLEIRLPASYPLGATAPTPVLHNVMMNPDKKRNLLEELVEMYEVDVEVSILWGERCREELLHSEDSLDLHNHCRDGVCYENGNDHAADYENDKHDDDNDNHSNKHGGEKQTDTTTYLPPTTKFNQPIRTFPTHIINNPLHQRTIARTRPFHPPKSGPGETMIGHAARVTSPEHVQWVLARLLFHDKKVAKANHNMFAYRFTEVTHGTTRRVADNDDDGEKGAGAKLAALLEMCKVDDVIVVVSRWFGGIHLGPARFKYIAAVGRDALVEGGLLKD